MPWYWNEIENKDSAVDATKAAVGISYLVGSLTTLLAVLSLIYARPIYGASGVSLIDAALFFVIAWRIQKLSRAWTVVGLSLYIIEAVSSFGAQGAGVGLLTIVFIIAYVNAVRGAFAYHRYQQEERQPLPQQVV